MIPMGKSVIHIGETVRLVYGKNVVSWETYQKAILNLEASGVATGQSQGTANVWARFSDCTLKRFQISI